MVSLSAAVRVWTADRFDLSEEGKALGLDSEDIVCGSISKIPQLELIEDLQFGTQTFILGTAEVANENSVLVSCGFFKKISAVNAEYQGTNGRHCGDNY